MKESIRTVLIILNIGALSGFFHYAFKEVNTHKMVFFGIISIFIFFAHAENKR